MRPRALVVEDDRPTRDVLRAILEGEGLYVDAVGDGEAAIEYLRTEKYTVVLLDVVLPKMSGIDVMHFLQTDRPASLARTVVITGLDVAEIRKVFPTVLDALAKPVLPARLRSVIRSAVMDVSDGAAPGSIGVA